MLVLLSSGATRRYRDDIIRILALPTRRGAQALTTDRSNPGMLRVGRLQR